MDNGNGELPSEWGQSGTQARPNVAGAQRVAEVAKTVRALPMNDRTFHAKALRHVCGVYQDIDQWAVEFIAALLTYEIFTNREYVGVTLDALIDWTGARARWQKRMQEGMRQAVGGGYVEVIQAPSVGDGQPGRYYDITEKGRRVYDAYNRKFAEVAEVAEQRRVVAVLNGEARRLRMLERRRRADEARRA